MKIIHTHGGLIGHLNAGCHLLTEVFVGGVERKQDVEVQIQVATGEGLKAPWPRFYVTVCSRNDTAVMTYSQHLLAPLVFQALRHFTWI